MPQTLRNWTHGSPKPARDARGGEDGLPSTMTSHKPPAAALIGLFLGVLLLAGAACGDVPQKPSTAVPSPTASPTPEPTPTATPAPTPTMTPTPTTDPTEQSASAANPDREALVALYHATDGATWKNSRDWLSQEPITKWFGVRTDAAGSRHRALAQQQPAARRATTGARQPSRAPAATAQGQSAEWNRFQLNWAASPILPSYCSMATSSAERFPPSLGCSRSWKCCTCT